MSLSEAGPGGPARAVHRPVLALADDLSGAAETAVALRSPARILLGPAPEPVAAEPGEALVVDLDSRQLPGAKAARAVRDATHAAPAGTVLFKKIDSLLRGNLAAEAAAYAQDGAGVVIATALPAARRTVLGGVVRLDGTPLHETDAWRAETRPAPLSVADALGDLSSAPVPLTVVRGAPGALREALRARFAHDRHPVCDAETEADLDAIAAAALELGPGVRLLGTGGLAGALGRLLGTPVPARLAPYAGDSVRPLLVVVGTAEPSARGQVAHLVADGAHHVALGTRELLRSPRRLAPPVAPVTVVRITGAASPALARRLVAALADTVADAAQGCDLVLTGGETARRVLDGLRITDLRPVGQVHHGAVVSRTPDGRSVVTRPGSYGEADSLRRIVRALRPAPVQHVPTDPTGVAP
ncbi:four-carbon acid sugar kinase family protein [Streptomyces viridochromogenes]|uniref:four-carbon acid sugar kinase family protein n=1 Tax=Streptomyces viridochromogenes TaxID=1938 RepID=UPI0001B5147A|nr:four-carbon acid sugar kinase family protein [Streptomyces viridochromogenes]